MAAQVLSFFQRSPRLAPRPTDWTQQELAEFYRVESALIRAGIRVGTDRGMSDENEPWFVFYRSEDGEVVIHFARIDGEYIIAGPAYEEIARGLDFTALVRNMVARHPLIRRSDNNSNLSIHPAALLVAVVGTAFFKTGEARAGETGSAGDKGGHARPVLLSKPNAAQKAATTPASSDTAYDTAQLPANQAVLILAAALMASNYQAQAETMDPGVRTAIASAAAALDFSGAPTTGVHADSLALSRPVSTTDIEASPTHMVSSVLSLVSLLSTLPVSQEAAVFEQAAQRDTDAAWHKAAPTFQPISSEDAAAWAIDVRLSHANAFAVDAVELVRAVVGEAPQRISVIEVGKLPEVLAKIIARGEHFEVSQPEPPQTPVETAPTTPTAPIEGSHGGDLGPVGGGETAPTTPVTPAPSTPTPPTTSPVFSGIVPTEVVRQFIDYFIAHTHNVQIMTEGREVVILDARVLSDPGSIDHLTSMTFHFFDGSSVNLVGHISSFLHDGVLV